MSSDQALGQNQYPISDKWVTNDTLSYSSARGHDDPQICAQTKVFLIVSQQSCCGLIIGYQKTNSLCCVTNQLAVFCSQNGYFTFVICEKKTDVYLSKVNKYKQTLKNLAMHCLAKSLVKTSFSQAIFVTGADR